MTGSSPHHTGARVQRARTIPTVAPVARAIRAALAVSATMLALSAPALAGDTCSHMDAARIGFICNSGFIWTGQDAGPSPVDLTRVRKEQAPASVIPAVGAVGWASDVSRPQLSSFDGGAAASIATWDEEAVDDITSIGGVSFAPGVNPSLLIDNTSPIDVYSPDGAATGLYAGGGDIWISNGSSIHASGYTAATGVHAWGDYVRVDNSGSIEADAVSGADYVPAIGVRVSGYDARVYSDQYGLISATASTDATYGRARARGIYATGYIDSVTVANDGAIQASAQAVDGRAEAHGIYAFGYGSATTVTNAGDIEASAAALGGSAYATGINSIGYGSGANNAEVVNTGSILAEADAAYAYSFGVFNLTRQRYGNAYFDNDGDIHAEATGNYATATGTLNLAVRYGDAVTSSSGSIEAVANGISGGSATGLFNYALVYDAIVDNSGAVSATSTGDMATAVGIYNQSVIYGATTTLNSGSVSAHAYGDASLANAAGLVGMSSYMVDINNYGDVDVVASTVDGGATAMGLYAYSYQLSTVRNYGDVSVRADSANDNASAYGAFVFGGFTGTGLLINGGSLSAEATAGDGAYAYAAGAIVMADIATIFNDASMSATASAGMGGTATATGARTYGIYSALNNYGDVVASATTDAGVAQAVGVQSYGYFGNRLYNAGDIQASASAQGGEASAVGAYSLGLAFTAEATNTGAISAVASGDVASAHGVINVAAYYGDATTTNSGSISAEAVGGLAPYGEAEAIAFGVYNFALLYNSVVDNSGSILASATATVDIDPTEGFLQAKAIGAMAFSGYAAGDTVVANSGEIGASALTSTGYAVAWGAVAQSSGVYDGIAQIDNDGAVWGYAHTDLGMAISTGAYAANLYGDSEIANHGDIVATADSERGITGVNLNFAVAYGARARSHYGNATIGNYGDIESNASVLGGIAYSYGVVASGMYASVHNAAGASVAATVEAELFGGAFVNGVTAGGMYGVDVVNDGSITAYALASGYTNGTDGFYGGSGATGIYAAGSFMGYATVVNNGVVNAIALAQNAPSMQSGGAGAVGIDGYADAVTIVNTGEINAIGQAEFGVVGVSGINAHGKYSNDITNAAGASVFAYASAGSLPGDPQPAFAVAWGTQTWASDYATTYNAGSIVAHAVATPDVAAAHGGGATAYGSTVGRYSGIVTSALVNLGDIEATADADFGYATAYGAYVHGLDEATLSNAGRIRAAAIAAEGNAFAVGSHLYSLNRSVSYNCDNYGCDWANPIVTLEGGQALIENTGDLVASANAAGGVGYSYGASTFAAFASGITNSGHITAVTLADDAKATAALVTSFYDDATLVNGGDIVASATGTTRADAIGAIVRGANGAQLDNAGRILAGAYGPDATATAVAMGDTGSNLLTNAGTIAALGDGTRIAISSGAGATATIVNQGSINGAIVTGDLDDSFENAAGGTWFAVGTSDLGAGNDRIVNSGAIRLDNAAIVMDAGVSAVPAGAVAPLAIGVGSAFYNDGMLAVSGSSNAIYTGTFFNNATISFVDGAPDDVLTIAGDFGGEGSIALDVSVLNQTADQLYIEGNVIEPTVQTINVNLMDAVMDGTGIAIPLVNVSGASLPGDFVLGDVVYTTGGFLALDFGLSNNGGVVSLGVDVIGLNSAGSLAAGVAPGAQAMADAQIGTWRQRMGVMPEKGRVGLSPWMRWFTASGDVEAQHDGNFGVGGILGFHQSNNGWELGLDYRPSEHLAFGVLLGKSDGNQSLEGGLGSDRFDGSTFGLYGTWTGGNGFYVDLSHRRMDVDARLRAASGVVSTETTATSLNVETGFTAWTLAGVNVMPQLQYTRTRIDDIELQDAGSTFVSEGGTSSRARLGVAFDKSFQTKGRYTLTPYGSLNVVRESDGAYDYSVNDGLFGSTRTDGTSAMLELGLGARKGGLSFGGGFNWTDGGAQQGVVGGQLTVRYGW